MSLLRSLSRHLETGGLRELTMSTNGTQLSRLSFDLRSDSECSAQAPQLVVVTTDEVIHRASCATGTVQPLTVAGWQRVSFDPANSKQLTPAVAPGAVER